MPSFDDDLLTRVEDASLNASAPPQQRWMDGWLLRTSPGKARRARCINAVALGRLPWAEKMARARALFDEAGLPLVMRITRFTQPATLDNELQAAGWTQVDDTQVLVCTQLPPESQRAPAGLRWQPLAAEDFSRCVGRLRGSPTAQQAAHAERLRSSPVPYRGAALVRDDGQIMACGQSAREGDLVGLYDVFTHPETRNQGLAGWLCKRLLSLEANEGAKVAYLQVEAYNHAAQAVYRRLGFSFGYAYHYRQPPGGGS